MGTRFAPSYANIFMGRLEQKLLKELEQMGLKPALYLRYIDDIFIICDQGEEKLKQFIKYVNDAHHSIKFTAEYSIGEVNFLDTKVIVDRTLNKVFTDLYTKNINTNNFLHYTSSHPHHCKKGEPFGEFLRLKRNCHRITDFEIHASQRLADYIRRVYPKKDLIMALDKARKINRDILLQVKETATENTQKRIPLILTFNPANPNPNKSINKLSHLVENCSNKDAFPEKPIIAYRRNKNLPDKLVRARCGPHPENRQLSITHDKFCPKPSQNRTHKSTTTGREYKGPAKYTCKTKNIIYLITCKRCGKQYVGETYRAFETRMKEHLRYIRKPSQYDKPTGRHFNQNGHNITDFQCRVIYIFGGIPQRYDHRRIEKEEFLIDQLKT